MKTALLQKRTDRIWLKQLDKIDDNIMRIKVACIVFWDFGGHFRMKKGYPERPEIKKITRQYYPYMENYIEEDELRDALMLVGYKKNLAEMRSKKPKKH